MILIVFIIFKTSLVCPCAFLLIDLPLSVFWEMGFKISYADFTLSSLVLFCIFFFTGREVIESILNLSILDCFLKFVQCFICDLLSRMWWRNRELYQSVVTAYIL